MQADALKVIQEIVEKANPGRRIVAAPAEPPHVYYVQNSEGQLIRTEAEPKPVRAQALDLASLAAWAKNLSPQVFYSRACVVAGVDPSDEQAGRIEFRLSSSPQLATLAQWAAAGCARVSQQQLVILLRTTFADCYPGFPRLLESVRAVQSKRAEDVSSQIQHGKVSVGRGLIAEMTGLNGVPEEVTFMVPVFAQPTVTAVAPVRVAIDPDPKTDQFALYVLPGQVEAAFAHGESRVRDDLEEMLPEVSLYRGTP